MRIENSPAWDVGITRGEALRSHKKVWGFGNHEEALVGDCIRDVWTANSKSILKSLQVQLTMAPPNEVTRGNGALAPGPRWEPDKVRLRGL